MAEKDKMTINIGGKFVKVGEDAVSSRKGGSAKEQADALKRIVTERIFEPKNDSMLSQPAVNE